MAPLKRFVLSSPAMQMRPRLCACTIAIAPRTLCFSTTSHAFAASDRGTWKAAAAASHAPHGSHHDTHHQNAGPEYYQVITPGFYRKFFSIVGFTTLFAMQHAYFTRLDETGWPRQHPISRWIARFQLTSEQKQQRLLKELDEHEKQARINILHRIEGARGGKVSLDDIEKRRQGGFKDNQRAGAQRSAEPIVYNQGFGLDTPTK